MATLQDVSNHYAHGNLLGAIQRRLEDPKRPDYELPDKTAAISPLTRSSISG